MARSMMENIEEASRLRSACLRLPRVWTPIEEVRLEQFERFRAGDGQASVGALRVGLEDLFRRGQYLQMHQLAQRITVRDLEVDTYLSVAAQAVEQLNLG